MALLGLVSWGGAQSSEVPSEGDSQQAQLMKQRLEAASKLIAGLGSERTRWTSDMETLHSTREYLVGDCLLAATSPHISPTSPPHSHASPHVSHASPYISPTSPQVGPLP